MNVVVICCKNKLQAVVEDDQMGADFVYESWLRGQGLVDDGHFTYDHVEVTTWDSVRQRIEPCAKNMTLFWDCNGQEIIVKRDPKGFHFQQTRKQPHKWDGPWTQETIIQLGMVLNQVFHIHAPEELAKRLLELPTSDTD